LTSNRLVGAIDHDGHGQWRCTIKKESPFPWRRDDFERVGWGHRPRWPWTMPLFNKKSNTIPATTSRLGTGWLVPLATMAMDYSHEFVYFNPSLDKKKRITVPATTSRHELVYLNQAVVIKMYQIKLDYLYEI
jgi:hypothetical protein